MFRVYNGDDVKIGAGGYVRLDLPGLGEVWATAWPTDEFWRANINDDPFSVELLGWGQAPTVWWHELTAEQQDALRSTL